MFARSILITLPLAACLNPVRAAENAVDASQGDSAWAGLLRVCAAEDYAFTPKVRGAYLAQAREAAKVRLKAGGKSLPPEFLKWVDADLDMAAGVYAAHPHPEEVLLWLYSLRLDLGEVKFEKYRQLALAGALVSAKEGMVADISPREPLELSIPGDPRIPVETKDSQRTLDVNDHIINFLKDHTVEADVAVGLKNPAGLKYDRRGIAIPSPDEKEKQEPVTKKRTRSLHAADVLASRDLQEKFNAYMKSKGHEVRIDCGERVIHWNSKEMVHGEQYHRINAAYLLFRRAYEAKGLLPVQRDPFASPAERCAYLIRNYEHTFPPELQAERDWPRFPLTAPWPILTMLAADRQPLREREERWVAFREKGEFHTYGEYTGGVAQQHSMQSARRLVPYPFSYATIQMMLKDGGVCGTMGSIFARGHNTLGIPASQATQPGHCAVAFFRYLPQTKTYQCQGGQYATGGDEKTGPFTPWPFAPQFRRINRSGGYEIEFHDRKPMVYHQSVAWGVNYGLRSYLDATIVHAVFWRLPEERRRFEGMKLLESGLARNPYHFLLIDAGLETARTPQEHLRIWEKLLEALSSADGKPGCPVDGLYNDTVKTRIFARIAKLPVPENSACVRKVLAFLEKEHCGHQATLEAYREAVKGS